MFKIGDVVERIDLEGGGIEIRMNTPYTVIDVSPNRDGTIMVFVKVPGYLSKPGLYHFRFKLVSKYISNYKGPRSKFV